MTYTVTWHVNEHPRTREFDDRAGDGRHEAFCCYARHINAGHYPVSFQSPTCLARVDGPIVIDGPIGVERRRR